MAHGNVRLSSLWEDHMSKIHLLNYNNYFNRRILLHSSLADYVSAQIAEFEDINFKPNDGAYTEIVLNLAENLTPDYLVVSDKVGGVDTLSSRWFILERKRLRDGQCRMTLRRDALVDFNSQVKNARIWCEKGYVKDDDPLIYNSEGNTYNQIKTTEKLLKDETGSAWIVGYCDNKLMLEAQNNTIDVVLNTSEPAWSRSYDNLTDLQNAFPGSDSSLRLGKIDSVEFKWKVYGNAQETVTYQITDSPNRITWELATEDLGAGYTTDIMAYVNYFGSYPKTSAAWNAAVSADKSAETSKLEALMNAAGTVCRIGTGTPYKYYRLNVDTTRSRATWAVTSGTDTMTILSAMFAGAVSAGVTNKKPDTITAGYFQTSFIAKWEDITDSITVSIADTVPINQTAPYYMFVMPYHPCKFNDENGTTRTANNAYTMPFVQQLIKDVGTHVLDVQILPYFPDRYFQNAGILLLDETDPKAVTWIKDANNVPISFIYWGAPQTFSFDLSESIDELPSRKIDNETRFCRLTAPNYSASFDFSIAKNRGISGFHVTCTYRPYQPHIQVRPLWRGIYGTNFNDGRGLICGGDYSVDIVNDAWTQYQISNKNYQLIFDRQIQSMDLQHDVQRMNEKFNAATGIFNAAAAGSIAGAAGGPATMVAGGLAAGLLSTVGAALDIKNNEKLRTDQRSAAFDMFQYNLGNIQAQPTTITKLSALAGNNKIWPFYEIYAATSREVSALELQLLWSGMTVNTIGYVKDFIGPSGSGLNFIRGKLIRITGLNEDAHIAQLIADEIARGVYFNY